MKATATAPSNIAFIKYWGRRDEVLRLPTNGSVSMNLSNLLSTTTVEFSPDYEVDMVIIDGKQDDLEVSKVIKHLDRIRKLANISYKARVVSQNNFPMSTGLSSSASGFAALTVAASKAAGLMLSEKELSIIARQGSGSACRSIPNGFVEWLDGETSETSYAVSICPSNYWDIVDIVVIVSIKEKDISTTEGQKLVSTNPFFSIRLAHIGEKIEKLKELINEKNFTAFGELLEAEALELHAIMLTSAPSLIYLLPETLHLMHLVKIWRGGGLPVYFTINTGQNIHLICEKKHAETVVKKLKEFEDVQEIIVNKPAIGTRLTSEHLF